MRHAFLICAHSSFKLLERLLLQLDDTSFDCYVHVDAKTGEIDYNRFESLTKKSKVYFLRDRISVTWGDVSQIAVTFLLLENAVKKDYDYYHFISGVDFPIKNNGYIKQFFETHKEKEFVGYTPWDPVLDYKLGLYHFFSADIKKKCKFIKWLDGKVLYVQERLGIRHYSNTHNFQKGCNWWDISDMLAKELIHQKSKILREYKFTLCGDEVFLQTFIWNKPEFRKRLYDENDEYKGCLRLIDWKRGNPYVWVSKDINELVASQSLFARKFSESDMTIIDLIVENINK